MSKSPYYSPLTSQVTTDYDLTVSKLQKEAAGLPHQSQPLLATSLVFTEQQLQVRPWHFCSVHCTVECGSKTSQMSKSLDVHMSAYEKYIFSRTCQSVCGSLCCLKHCKYCGNIHYTSHSGNNDKKSRLYMVSPGLLVYFSCMCVCPSVYLGST